MFHGCDRATLPGMVDGARFLQGADAQQARRLPHIHGLQDEELA
jgi:hypothetical protein